MPRTITLTEQTTRYMMLKRLASIPCTCDKNLHAPACIACVAARILNSINEYTDDRLQEFFDTFTATAIYKALGQ